MKTHAARHGDPRHHSEDIAELKAENARLSTAIDELRQNADPYCASLVSISGVRIICDRRAHHGERHGGVYPSDRGGPDVEVQW